MHTSDMTKLIVTFLNFAIAPEKVMKQDPDPSRKWLLA